MLDYLDCSICLVQKPQTFLVTLIQRPELRLFSPPTTTNSKTQIPNAKKKRKIKNLSRQRNEDELRCLGGFAAEGSASEGGDGVAELIPFQDSETVVVNGGLVLVRNRRRRRRGVSKESSALEADSDGHTAENGGSQGDGDGAAKGK